MFCLFSTVGVALGALTLWHAVLISRGETSIERHINIKETKRKADRGKVNIKNFTLCHRFLFDSNPQLIGVLIALPGLQKPL